MLTQEEKELIQNALEFYVEHRKKVEKAEMQEMLKKDLLLIVGTPSKRLHELSMNLNSINKRLGINALYKGNNEND